MTGSSRPYATLAAIAASSAMIVGGILAASAAVAEPTKAPSHPAPAVAASDAAPPAVRLPESHPRDAHQLPTTGRFYGTQEEFDRAVRASMIKRYDPEDESLFPPVAAREDGIAVGPTPCNSCDPLDLDTPSSLNYDPTLLAVYQEDDLLPPPEGPGFASCGGLSATGPFWAGKNDQCWGPSGQFGDDVDNVERQIPTFTSIGQHYAICGRMGRINTSGFIGDPNNPGGTLKPEDADIWEIHLATGLDMRVSGYFQVPNLRFIMTLNGVRYQDDGVLGQFRDCNDDYYVFNSWATIGFQSDTPCGDGVWEEFLSSGYWFMVFDPRTEAPVGTPGAQLCEYWYNIEIETADPVGACCIGDTCT